MALLGLQIVGFATGLVSIVLGVLILIFPKLLRFLLGIYFIFVGILALIGSIV